MILDAADVSVDPADIAEPVVAEVLPDVDRVTVPLSHAIVGHVVAVKALLEGIFGEDGLGRNLDLRNSRSVFEEFAWIAVGGVLVVVVLTCDEAIDGIARVIVHVGGSGATECLLVASLVINGKSSPVKLLV